MFLFSGGPPGSWAPGVPLFLYAGYTVPVLSSVQAAYPMARSGFFRNLYVNAPQAGSQSLTIAATVYINGTSTSLSASIAPAGVTAFNTSNVVGYSPNDKLSVQILISGALSYAGTFTVTLQY
jgi:hypothetical protein